MDSIYNTLPEPFNLTHYLMSRNANHRQKNLIVTEERNFTHGEINGQVFGWQHILKEHSCSNGDRIALILEDGVALFSLFLAAVSKGIIPVFINPQLGLEVVKQSLLDSTPSLVIWSEGKHSPEMISFINENHFKELRVSPDFLTPEQNLSIDELSFVWKHKNDLAFIAYTSGSTSKPKGVMHAHYSPIVACTLYADKFLKLCSEDLVFSGPSIAFTYGLGTSLYMPMYVGAAIVLCSQKDAFALVNTINTLRPTVFFGVPSHYASILTIKTLVEFKNDRLRLCVCAGERLPQSIWQRWYEMTSLKICEGLGTTESTHIFISNHPNDPKANTIGKPVPGYHVHLGDNSELTLKGEGLMLGYWKGPDSPSNKPIDALILNDYFEVDSTGQYHFVGRNDGLHKVRGLWVSPSQIEDVALQLSEVQFAKAMIAPNPDHSDLNDIFLYLQLDQKHEDQVYKRKIQSHLRQQLEGHQIPKKIVFVSRFPLTSTGKIDAKRLMALEANEENHS